MDFLSVISGLKRKAGLEVVESLEKGRKLGFSLLDRYAYRVSLRKREGDDGVSVLMYIGLNRFWTPQYEALRARIFRKVEEFLEERGYRCLREAHTVYAYAAGEPWVRVMLDSHLYHPDEEIRRPQIFLETPAKQSPTEELLKHMALRVLDVAELVYKALAVKLKQRGGSALEVFPSNALYELFGMEEVLLELADRYQGWLTEDEEDEESDEDGWLGEEPYEEVGYALNLVDDLHSELEYAFLLHEPWLLLDQLSYMLYMVKCVLGVYRDKGGLVSLLESKMGYLSLVKNFVKKLGRGIKHIVEEVGYSGGLPRLKFDDRVLMAGRGVYIPWERYKRDVKLTVKAVLRESRLLKEEIHMLKVVANP